MPKTKLRSKLITIDPKDFTSSQWVEMYNASGCCDYMGRGNEKHHHAKAVKVSKAVCLQMAGWCEGMAERVRDGEYGESDETVNIDEWADQLDQAAAVLEGYLK